MNESNDEMTAVDDPEVGAEELVLPRPAGASGEGQVELAARLVEQAQAEGVALVGPDGVLAELAKLVLEAAPNSRRPICVAAHSPESF